MGGIHIVALRSVDRSATAGQAPSTAEAVRCLAIRAFCLCVLGLFAVSTAAAQSVEEFYRGKTVTIVVGYTPGGGYDAYARLLARHLNRHIPGKIDLSVRFARALPDDMPADVPFIGDLAQSDEDKQVIDFIFSVAELGRPFAVSQEVPADRLAALRAAFDETMKEPDFLAESKKLQLPVIHVPADQAEEIVKANYATPRRLIERADEILR
jgi:hypothetical protein